MIKGLKLKAVFWLAVGTWAISLFLSREPFSLELLRPSGLVLGIVTAVVTLFERYIWRWKILHPWFVSVPDLTGTYSGTISSTWLGQGNTQGGGVIPVYLSVFQTLSSLTVRLYTEESASISLCSALIESEDGYWEVVYTYRNEPDLLVQERSRIHHGGLRMKLEDDTPLTLRGNYFTDRSTSGEAVLKRVSSRRTKSFIEASKIVSSS